MLWLGKLCAEAKGDQAMSQIHLLVLVHQSCEPGAFTRAALQFLLLGGVWESPKVSTASSALPAPIPPPEGTELFHTGAGSTLETLRLIPLSLTINTALGQQEQLCNPQPLWTGSQAVLGHQQPKPLPLGLLKTHWGWLDTTCSSKGEGKHFCSSSSDFFLFRMAAPSSSSLTSSCLQVLCLFFPCIIFNLDK